MSHTDQQQQTLSRRAALKVLTATGSALTLSTLPKQWERPLVEVGALPAFAQTSTPTPTLTLTPTPTSTPDTGDLIILIAGPFGPCDPGGGQPGDLFTFGFDYNDPSGGIIADQARVRVVFEFSPSGTTNTSEIILSGANITGNATTGSVEVPTCIGFGADSSVTLTVSLINAAGAGRGQGTATIQNPSTPRPGTPAKGSLTVD